MNGRYNVLEVTRFQHARVEHEGVEMWEGDRRGVGSGTDATPTPNATPTPIPMSIVLGVRTADRTAADRIDTEAKRLPMEYERRQIGNRTQHRAKRAEINHGAERPHVVTVPPQRQRRQPRKTLRRARVYAAEISRQHEVLHVEGFEHAWGLSLTWRVNLCRGGGFHQKGDGTGLAWTQRAKREMFQSGKVTNMGQFEGEVREMGVAHVGNRQAAPTTGRIEHRLERGVESLKISPVFPPPYFDIERSRTSGFVHLQHTRRGAWGDAHAPP